LWYQLESRACACYGIPPIIIPLGVGLARSTYSNYKEARRSFAEETLQPIWRGLEEAFTRSIFGPGGPFVYRFNLENFSALFVDIEGPEAPRHAADRSSGDGRDAVEAQTQRSSDLQAE
jgi:phage portal protein BeeE